MKIDVKILDPRLQSQLPTYATPGSAGLDAALRGRRVGERVQVHAFRRDELRQFTVRLAAAPPDTAELLLDEARGMSKKSIK